MSILYLTLQAKGGVGKSYVSSILAQYLQERGRSVRCIDTNTMICNSHRHPQTPADVTSPHTAHSTPQTRHSAPHRRRRRRPHRRRAV